MRLIQIFGSRFEAEQFKSFLAGSGIDALLRSDDEAGLMPPLAYQGGVKVFVRDEDFKRAFQLLNSFSNEEHSDVEEDS